jgi:hypothetical protein
MHLQRITLMGQVDEDIHFIGGEERWNYDFAMNVSGKIYLICFRDDETAKRAQMEIKKGDLIYIEGEPCGITQRKMPSDEEMTQLLTNPNHKVCLRDYDAMVFADYIRLVSGDQPAPRPELPPENDLFPEWLDPI